MNRQYVTTAPASLPPAGLPGIDPSWSRLVAARDSDGTLRTWHVLDTHADARDMGDVVVTLLCVHGNPTWSYLWRRLLQRAPDAVRVVAVDQLDMGYSERTGVVRRLAQRVDDLSAVVDALGVAGPVVTVAHDWGGPISLGWALAHRERLAGVVLLNTAVHQPDGSAAPSLIRWARSAPLIRATTVDTGLFVRATTWLSGPTLPRDVAAAYAAPYARAARRRAIETFVEDIPLEADHPSASTLRMIAEGVRTLDVPTLLLWGPGDPVFADRYLNDLLDRLPHANVHRYEGARHLVIEDAPSLVDDLLLWVSDLVEGAPDPSARPDPVLPAEATPLWSALEERASADPHGTALAEHVDGSWRKVTWRLLADNVSALARGLQARQVRPGDRVAVLVRPGADLLAVVYACWRLGASVVVTDAGLGARGIVRALRGAAADHIIAIPRGMALVRAARIPGQRIGVGELRGIAEQGRGMASLPEGPGPDDEALVAFTSGSTGPAKGVVYRHRQVQRTVALLRMHYRIGPDDALVAAFAPWSVLGPALGIASSIPDMDVTSPRTLEARALADATSVIGGTLLWASPAAFASVLRTAGSLSDAQVAALGRLRLVMGAGAPVSADLLHGMARLCPAADVRTPYGMTEVLPVADVAIEEIDAAGAGDGVLVGRPVPGVDLSISEVDGHGRAVGAPTAEPGVLGEVLVRADHGKDRYDRLWATERAAARNPGWHRTGDVGVIDERGRLWIGGRLTHVITTAEGPRAPVGIEQAVRRLPEVEQAAAVGVGPAGTQQVVVVVVGTRRRSGLADLDLTSAVRKAAGVPVAAVLERRALPVDIRHNSKVDRTAVADWASSILVGRA